MFRKLGKWEKYQQKADRKLYDDIPETWYFKVEAYVGYACQPSFYHFTTLKQVEFWYYTTRDLSILCITDRTGARVLTDFASANKCDIDFWVNTMRRPVLDLRHDANKLYLPQDDHRVTSDTPNGWN